MVGATALSEKFCSSTALLPITCAKRSTIGCAGKGSPARAAGRPNCVRLSRPDRHPVNGAGSALVARQVPARPIGAAKISRRFCLGNPYRMVRGLASNRAGADPARKLRQWRNSMVRLIALALALGVGAAVAQAEEGNDDKAAAPSAAKMQILDP